MREDKDIHGRAISDFLAGDKSSKLWVHSRQVETESMPVAAFIRQEATLPELESKALALCKGKVLDVGSGTGVHSKMLMRKGHEVLAIEQSPLCVALSAKAGVPTLQGDFFEHAFSETFDTILLMMNGIGIVGTLSRLPLFVEKCRKLLNPGGQIIFDSSDIVDVFSEFMPESTYYGEIDYQFEYKTKKGDWFKWLYIDPFTMDEFAQKNGIKSKICYMDSTKHYLCQWTF